jgi:hypothetical protein
MPSKPFRSFSAVLTLAATLLVSCAVHSQTETARISGVVTDASGAVVVDADVVLTNIDQGTSTTVVTNHAGIYILPSVRPGQYRMSARKDGFKIVDVLGVVVNVQDRLEENFRLQPGSKTESITVTGGVPLVNTEDATVSTVVDRNFAENIPMNGRSFQTLIELTPGVVTVAAGANHGEDSGQFSINGQRPAANYWMVDGVSANADSNALFGGNQIAGATGVTSVLGGTNSLVSVDAMQEFRIQTSTFAPEFGRTPGGQISIVTRSGTNAFHGTAFDYLRNDVLDAKNWFDGYVNNPPLPKAEERQNDFGATFSGRILKDRTFFFFSYEGLRLRLPTTTLSTVPDLAARQNSPQAVQTILDAYPLPNAPAINGGTDPGFNATYSNPATLNAYSIRLDHRLTGRFTLFGRYNYAPSENRIRGPFQQPLSNVERLSSTAQQGTVGLTGNLTATLANELRVNYSKTESSSIDSFDNFGGAVPFPNQIPSPYSAFTGQFVFDIFSLNHGEIFDGPTVRNVQRQINVVDTINAQKGAHSLKFGADYRRLTPIFDPVLYSQFAGFLDVPSTATGNVFFSISAQDQGATFRFQNLSLFSQDTWRVRDRVTLTYGLRWDIDFAPTSISGAPIQAVTGFNRSDLSQLALAPSGTSPFQTNFHDLAPRIGLAYQVSQDPTWGSVLRSGLGVFYDLATSETPNVIRGSYPFVGPTNFQFGGPFPLTPAAAAAPPITPPSTSNPTSIQFFDPALKSPYTLEWNAAFEQQLGTQQSLSLTYVGAAGRRLLQSTVAINPAPAFPFVTYVTNSATSDYHALQVRFERRLAKGLQVLSSYVWSHSIDDGSSGSNDYLSNASAGSGNPGNRGPSSFDIRHSFSTGLTYALSSPVQRGLVHEITKGWSLQSVFETHTAQPVEVSLPVFRNLNGLDGSVRPDVLPGIPMYLYGSQYPGGRALNDTKGAGTCSDGNPSVGPFCAPPLDSSGVPIRQGNLGRNALRAFDLFQWNLGVHREFPIREKISLQFRAEMFNVLNHPNFAPPASGLSYSTNGISAPSGYGLSSQTLNEYLGGGVGGGGFNALYQIGGPRSIQLALKFSF